MKRHNAGFEEAVKIEANDYVIRVVQSPAELDAVQWNSLLAQQDEPTPFMRHEYLAALHHSGCAQPGTGWAPHFMLMQRGKQLLGACAIYRKVHSQGEYVFDWSWANAYAQHGLAYYPKALVAVPFTPVPGSRLLAHNSAQRVALAQALVAWCKTEQLSSLHLLFSSRQDIEACEQAGLMLRHTVQFHWNNTQPGYADFEAF